MKIRNVRRRACRAIGVEWLESRIQLSTLPGGSLAIQLTTTAAVGSFEQTAAAGGATVQTTSIPGLVEVQGPASSLAAVSAAAARNPWVQYAAPEQTVQATTTPNDPEYTKGNLYGLNGTYGINAPGAWSVTTGSPATVTIASTDSGVDYDQPDLYQNIWINQAEIPTSRMQNLTDVYHDGYISWRDLNDPVNKGQGKITDVNGDGVIDAGDILAPMTLNAQGQDTGQGGWANPSNTQDGDTAHPDDLIGWNFVSNNNNPFDDNGHGTHTAGIMAAMGNNGVGVVGVNWTAQVMVIKMLNSSGSGTDVAAALAIQYAANHGARVANASWGGSGTDTITANAISYAMGKNMVFVAAAGNNGQNTDTSPFWPADSGVANEISAGASTSNGSLASYSDFGLKTVSLFAPGSNIESTYLNGQYVYESGTSMATPYITGTVALLAGLHPTWSYSQLINQVETTATAYSQFLGKSVTGGLLDAAAAVAAVYPGSATFAGSDTANQGNWPAAYGASGFDVSQDSSTNNPTLPSYATLNITGGQPLTWSSNTSDPRGLLVAAAGSTKHIAAAWDSSTAFSVNLSLSDGQTHPLALYAVDWDGAGGGRSERIDLIDNNTGTVVDTRTVSSFQNGTYLTWNVSGSLTIRVTNLNSATNAVLSGLFIGGSLNPTIATAAAAGANPVTGTSTTLGVLGADANYSASALTYTWAAVTVPTGAATPTFSASGTNAAQQTTVNFFQAGTYTFMVTIADPGQRSRTTTVTVTVAPTSTTVSVAPATATVADGGTQSFTATAFDQFGQVLATQPAFIWNASGVGSINAAGLYTAGAVAGPATITATAGSAVGTAAVTVVNSTLTLAAVAPQTVTAGQMLNVTLQASGGNGTALSYTATAETLPYWLEQTYGFYEDVGGYYLGYRGQQEEYLRAKVSVDGYNTGGIDPWYYLLPNGNLYEFTPPYTNPALTGALVAQLGTSVYNNPALLWNAQNTPVPATLGVTGNQLTITPAGTYSGTFVAIANASNGQSAATTSFTVTVTASTPLTLAAIAPQMVAAGQPLTLTLQATGSSGSQLTYAASAESQLYWLEQTYGFYEDNGGYYVGFRGQQEKYLRARVSIDGYNTGGIDPWYYLLPSGDLYEFTPPYTNPALTGALVAHLGAAVYSNPALLWNAQNTPVPATLAVAGNQLTITPAAGSSGMFLVTASVTDGQSAASTSFAVTVSQSLALAPVSAQTDTAGQPLTVALQAIGASGGQLTYSASAETLSYWLEQTYGFYEDAGGYYQGYRGQAEKYLRAKVSVDGYNTGGIDPWYYLLPSGNLYEFTPPYGNAALTGALVAQLGVAVYNDPRLLWNAQNAAVPALLSLAGNQLTLTPDGAFSGTFVVIAGVTDGSRSASTSFTVTVS
jgi:subtilisin family serine protease